MVEYSFSRLCFKADIIEQLNDNEKFAVHTPYGVFQMSKAEFYETFPNIVKTESYQKNRIYSMKHPTKKAMRFLTSATPQMNLQVKAVKRLKDLIGIEIREKIREIGEIWRNSEHNPQIDNEVLNHWQNIIIEWSEDTGMPLIIRKDANKLKGMSITHPSGREIVVSDNTFAIWVYNRVMNKVTYNLEQLKEMLFENEIPMVFMQTKGMKEKAKYTKPLGAFSLPDWKLCHIEPVGFNSNKTIEELSINDIKEHFKKYASPSNMFVLPKEIGDLGEIQIFIDEQRR
jgi:hypothetical protein